MRKILMMLTGLILILAGCGGTTDTTEMVEQVEGEQIKIYTGWTDIPGYNDQESGYIKYVEEATGQDVEYIMGPLENGTEKLMMELASGTEYNLVTVGKDAFGDVVTEGVALDLTPF